MLGRLQQGVRRILSSTQEDVEGLTSFVLIAYNMPAQAENTIRSLLPDYQRGVRLEDYEVLVVENESANNISPDFLKTLPYNFSYHLRHETQPTPIHAINYGLEQAAGRNICVMIDGARLLTPGVVRNTILGHRISPLAIVTVPGYHLGFELQQKAVGSGYDTEQEAALMRSIAWPEDGYRLFEIACFSGSCVHGFYLPHSESNCISMPRRIWEDLGGYDPRFDKRGGGLVNLDLYKRACEYPGIKHVFLHGEGTFHQFHGGVTTGGENSEDRQQFIDEIKEQYQQIRGQSFSSPETDPIFLGELPRSAQKFVHTSSTILMDRLRNSASTQDCTIPVLDD